jgi:hypothetical protein
MFIIVYNFGLLGHYLIWIDACFLFDNYVVDFKFIFLELGLLNGC